MRILLVEDEPKIASFIQRGLNPDFAVEINQPKCRMFKI